MKKNNVVPISVFVAAVIGYVIAVFGLVYGFVSDELVGCSMLGQSSKVTLSVLAICGTAGGAIALKQGLSRLIEVMAKSASPIAAASEEDIKQALCDAQSVLVFVSRSDGMRTEFTKIARRLPPSQQIKVLVRDDGSQGRAGILAAEAKRWRDDVVGNSSAIIQIRTYTFDPLMFRGIVLDRRSAILGWYFKGDPLQQIHDLPMYKVNDADTVEHVALAFDDMFNRGHTI